MIKLRDQNVEINDCEFLDRLQKSTLRMCFTFFYIMGIKNQ